MKKERSNSPFFLAQVGESFGPLSATVPTHAIVAFHVFQALIENKCNFPFGNAVCVLQKAVLDLSRREIGQIRRRWNTAVQRQDKEIVQLLGY